MFRLKNSPEALEQAIKIYKDSSFAMDQSKSFLAMLALNQKRPDIALDVLPMDSEFTLDMNLMLLLMAELGNWKGVCDLLHKIKSNREKGRRYRVYNEVVSLIKYFEQFM